jgi:hypothetical protein
MRTALRRRRSRPPGRVAANTDQIRAAAEEILNDGRFTTEAKRRSADLALRSPA